MDKKIYDFDNLLVESYCKDKHESYNDTCKNILNSEFYCCSISTVLTIS